VPNVSKTKALTSGIGTPCARRRLAMGSPEQASALAATNVAPRRMRLRRVKLTVASSSKFGYLRGHYSVAPSRIERQRDARCL
jgi:hypothetical protein